MKINLLELLFTVLCILQLVNTAKILIITPAPYYAHHRAYRPIWNQLLAKNHHELTIITPIPMTYDGNLKNLKQIDLGEVVKAYKKLELVKYIEENPVLGMLTYAWGATNLFMEILLENEEIQDVIKKKDEYDLVFIETPLSFSLHLPQYFKAPCIGIFSMDSGSVLHQTMGNFVHAIAIPDQFIAFVGKLSLFGRVASVVGHVTYQIAMMFMEFYLQYVTVEHIGVPTYPNKGYDMLFIAENPICTYNRPVTEATHFMRAIRLKETQETSKQLQALLDESSNGIIYFSLGTNVHSEDFNENLENDLINAFSELPYDIVWKYDKEIKNEPKNVFLTTWAPQQAILRHPNVKLFFTQGGCQSFEETIYNRVPVVVMPFFFDQEANAKKAVMEEIGVELDRQSVTKEEIKGAILEVISNPKYKKTINKMADLALDTPIDGLESTMFQIERILRHNGSHYKKGAAVNLPLYQYYFLDVIAVLSFLMLVFCISVYLLIKFVCKCCCKQDRTSSNKKNQ